MLKTVFPSFGAPTTLLWAHVRIRHTDDAMDIVIVLFHSWPECSQLFRLNSLCCDILVQQHQATTMKHRFIVS